MLNKIEKQKVVKMFRDSKKHMGHGETVQETLVLFMEFKKIVNPEVLKSESVEQILIRLQNYHFSISQGLTDKINE